MAKLMRKLDIQKLRSEKKITQKELSLMTGYPQAFVSKMERGKVSVPESFIAKVKEVLSISDIDAYVTFEEQAANNTTEDIAAAPQEMTDKMMIQRLFELLEKREARIEKLENENDELRRELSALKSNTSN